MHVPRAASSRDAALSLSLSLSLPLCICIKQLTRIVHSLVGHGREWATLLAHVTRAAPASRDAAHAIATVLQRPHDPSAAMADPSAEVALIRICLFGRIGFWWARALVSEKVDIVLHGPSILTWE